MAWIPSECLRLLLFSSCALWVCLLRAGPVDAGSGVELVGDELEVNTYAQNNQSFPEMAMAPDGSAVVAWESLNVDDDFEGACSNATPRPASPSTASSW